MKRKIEEILITWKQKANRLPLIVRGARQVGKTYTILNFGKKHYKKVLYFNFENNNELASIFQRDLNTKRIINELEIYLGESFDKDCLIFFDEIQSNDQALNSLKYFAEENAAYHIIAAGSLLGVAVNRQNYSFPVGKVDFADMYPLDFEEFLWALNKPKVVQLIKENFHANTECNLHDTFLDLFRQYMYLGGMPQVIKEYLELNDYATVQSLQKNIDNSYIADMAKYATKEETVRIYAAYQSMLSQLAKENKKFQYKTIKSGSRANVYETAIDWLKSSGIVLMCYKINQGYIPLNAHADYSSFKMYHADVGILSSKYNLPANLVLTNNTKIDAIKGVLTENYVATALHRNGYQLFYWESKGIAEMDFVIQNNNGDIIPIEVKSSEHVRSKSLLQFVTNYKPIYSYRISTRNFGFENNIKSIPLYATFCI